jgi:lambda repressor-like predicted transcriptional regulator
MTKHITPPQKIQALTLRSAGYTITAISDKTNISVSTLKRLFKTHSVKKGELKKKVISKATDELIHDASTIEVLKREASSLIHDDLAIVRRLRAAMAEAIEVLEATDTTEALQVMRAVSAGAVALKSTSETLRKTLGMDKDDDATGDLPELVISVLTEDEMQDIRNHAASMSAGLDNGMGDFLSESIEDDVVIEGMDEPVVVSA